MAKLFAFAIALLTSVQALAMIQLPDGVCDLEGRLVERKVNDQPTLFLQINEGTGAAKVLIIKNPTDARLKNPLFLGNTVRLRLKIAGDVESDEGQAEFVSFRGRVPSFEVLKYSTPEELATACNVNREPQSKKKLLKKKKSAKSRA